MFKGLLFTATLLLTSSAMAFESFDDFMRQGRNQQSRDEFSSKVIYGEDDRTDWYDFKSEELKNIARSSAALIRKSKLTRSAHEGWMKIDAQAYGAGMQMCSTERFVEQPTATFCSGFLAAPDKIVTAGHCIESESECMNTAFVFDFTKFDADYDPTNVLAESVYNCKRVIHTALDSAGNDYAIIQLDREVQDRQPVRLRREGKLEDFSEVVVLGYPHGIPLKSSVGKVRTNTHDKYFTATLDTYGGNSGSMVLSTASLEVEGILVRGEPDVIYDREKQCYVSKVCAEDACYGEESSRISAVIPYLEAAFLWAPR